MITTHQNQINRLYDVIEKRDVEIAERDTLLREAKKLCIESIQYRMDDLPDTEKLLGAIIQLIGEKDETI